MTLEMIIVAVVVAVVFISFVREVLSPDIVAMAGMGALIAVGILDTHDALSVFSNGAPITIMCMFVLSAALERTGCLDTLGAWISKVAGKSPLRALVAIMILVIPISAFMNNTPVVVVLTPIVIAFSRSIGDVPSRFLIPLSYAAILGGTTTLIGTSTNLIANGAAINAGMKPFSMFEITAPGVIMASVGSVYLLLAGRFMLPVRKTIAGLLEGRPKRPFLAEVIIPAGSPMIGKKIADSKLSGSGRNVLDVIRGNVSLRFRIEAVELKAGDIVVLESDTGEMLALKESGEVEFRPMDPGAYEPLQAAETVIMEGIVGPHSRFAGMQVSNLRLRRLYDVYVMGVHRHDRDYRDNFGNLRLAFGDTLLIEGPPEGVSRLLESGDLVSLSHPQRRAVRRSKAPFAIFSVLAVVLLSALNIMPIEGLALIGAFAVVLFGCLDHDEIYKRVDWSILFLIFGMIGISMAMEESGLAMLLVSKAADLTSGLPPLATLAIVYVIAMILTETISNNAVALLLTPIVIGIAQAMGLDPRPFVVAVMFAASASFATPIGYQTNTFVYNAGGYKFTDFIKVGLPLNILMWITAIIVIPLFWPLVP